MNLSKLVINELVQRKSKLITSWTRGGNHGPDLQEVRNQFGSSWLASFKLPR